MHPPMARLSKMHIVMRGFSSLGLLRRKDVEGRQHIVGAVAYKQHVLAAIGIGAGAVGRGRTGSCSRRR
jgi:hypothetical protein